MRDKASNEATQAYPTSLWIGYKEQALIWRMVALLQIPTTFLGTCATLLTWVNADIIIRVPDRLRSGYHLVSELPDSEFIDFARCITFIVQL